ncbi:MAG: hypothetical protein V5804_07535 [Mucilaginibacter sp.]|uniref:hypothetical protein n=1 Tax=Mucilaginibacter sp. TaxID=1882438 RepID=UPI0034E3F72F
MRVKHKNQIFATIQKSGLDVKNFNYTSEQTASIEDVYIEYAENDKPTGLKFNIRISDDSFDLFNYRTIIYSPSMQYSIWFPRMNYASIDDICDQFNNWINRSLKEYIADKLEVDLWEEYQKGNTLLNVNESESGDNSFFSLNEKQQIKLSLNDLKQLIPKQFDINPLQLESINQRLDYLAEGLDRLNKFDWKSVLVNQFLNIGTTLALNPDQFVHLRDLFIKLLHIIPLLN